MGLFDKLFKNKKEGDLPPTPKWKSNLKDNALRQILLSIELHEIEIAITDACKTYINKEHVDFTIGSLRREITNSGLTIQFLHEQLRTKKIMIIRFGINLLNKFDGQPIEEEYPIGESVPKSQRSKVVETYGVGIGFGIKYAIYLYFLENNPKGLIHFLEKERIPMAKKFCKTLEDLYKL